MKNFVAWVTKGLVCALLMFGAPIASANTLDAAEKTRLQASLLQFLESGRDATGAFRVIDRDTGVVVNAHPGALHPKIVPFGVDYVLCIEMYDENGGRHDADFILRKTADKWVVVDVLFDQRDLLKKALSEID